MLLDCELKLITALENPFGRELIQQSSDGALHDVFLFRAP
jgi:hypothetical protein